MNTASPVLAAMTAFSSGSRGARNRSPGVTLREAAMNWDVAWATSMTKAHHHSEEAAAVRPSTKPGHHLPPARLVASQVLLDDEAQPHPAQDDHQHPRGHGPHRQPGLLDNGMVVGQSGRGSGENVSHTPLPSTLGDVRGCRPFHHAVQGPVDPLDHPAGSRPGPAVRVQGAQHLVPQPLGLVDGDQGVEDVVVAAVQAGDGHHQQKRLLGVQLGLAVQDRVLEGVLPALGELLLAALYPVGVGDPLAGVGMAQGVVEDGYWRLRRDGR